MAAMFRVSGPLGLALFMPAFSLLRLTGQQPTSSAPAPKTATCSIHRSTALVEAENAINRGQFDDAGRLLREQMSTITTEKDRAHDGVIRVLLRQHKLSEAETDALAWNKAEPKNAWSRLALGQVQWRRGKVGEAIESLAAAGRLDPCNAQVRADFARVFSMSGLLASAKRNLDRPTASILTILPSATRGLIYSLGRYGLQISTSTS